MDVWPEVIKTAARMPELSILEPTRTAMLARRFTDAFVSDATRRWWWDALRPDVPTDAVPYGDGDAWASLSEWLPDRRLVLLVTDDEPVPAGAVEGRPRHLAELVAECWYFEYVVTDDDASFGVFDTHHNTLIRVGSLPD